MKQNSELGSSDTILLYWHCLQCGAHDPVEPTGGTEQEQYALGDHEPCIKCGYGTAHVVTLRMGAHYEQGLALGMDISDAWERARKPNRSHTHEEGASDPDPSNGYGFDRDF